VEYGQRLDKYLLKLMHVLPHILATGGNINNWIAHKLSRTVKGYIPSPVCAKNINPFFSKRINGFTKIFNIRLQSKGINRRMFQQQQRVANELVFSGITHFPLYHKRFIIRDLAETPDFRATAEAWAEKAKLPALKRSNAALSSKKISSVYVWPPSWNPMLAWVKVE